MKSVIKVPNLATCSCDNSIHALFAKVKGVFGVKVDNVRGEIVIDHTDEVNVSELEKIFFSHNK